MGIMNFLAAPAAADAARMRYQEQIARDAQKNNYLAQFLMEQRRAKDAQDLAKQAQDANLATFPAHYKAWGEANKEIQKATLERQQELQDAADKKMQAKAEAMAPQAQAALDAIDRIDKRAGDIQASEDEWRNKRILHASLMGVDKLKDNPAAIEKLMSGKFDPAQVMAWGGKKALEQYNAANEVAQQTVAKMASSTPLVAHEITKLDQQRAAYQKQLNDLIGRNQYLPDYLDYPVDPSGGAPNPFAGASTMDLSVPAAGGAQAGATAATPKFDPANYDPKKFFASGYPIPTNDGTSIWDYWRQPLAQEIAGQVAQGGGPAPASGPDWRQYGSRGTPGEPGYWPGATFNPRSRAREQSQALGAGVGMASAVSGGLAGLAMPALAGLGELAPVAATVVGAGGGALADLTATSLAPELADARAQYPNDYAAFALGGNVLGNMRSGVAVTPGATAKPAVKPAVKVVAPARAPKAPVSNIPGWANVGPAPNPRYDLFDYSLPKVGNGGGNPLVPSLSGYTPSVAAPGVAPSRAPVPRVMGPSPAEIAVARGNVPVGGPPARVLAPGQPITGWDETLPVTPPWGDPGVPRGWVSVLPSPVESQIQRAPGGWRFVTQPGPVSPVGAPGSAPYGWRTVTPPMAQPIGVPGLAPVGWQSVNQPPSYQYLNPGALRMVQPWSGL